MTFSRNLALLAAAAFLVAAAPFAPPPAGKRTIYRHATLIDSVALQPKANTAVITDGERIVAVLSDRDLTQAQLQGAQQVDLSGRFLVPGYIDSHQHLATPPDRAEAEARLKRDVYSGITATREGFGVTNHAVVALVERVGEHANPFAARRRGCRCVWQSKPPNSN